MTNMCGNLHKVHSFGLQNGDAQFMVVGVSITWHMGCYFSSKFQLMFIQFKIIWVKSVKLTLCCFFILIKDAEDPIISDAPRDISRNTDPNDSRLVVIWRPPKATDNSGFVTLTSSHTLGDSFPIGTTTVTYTAIDPSFNEATASFVITIVGRWLFHVMLRNWCYFAILSWAVLTGTDSNFHLYEGRSINNESWDFSQFLNKFGKSRWHGHHPTSCAPHWIYQSN